MTSLALSARSLPPRVGTGQLCSEGLSPAAPDPILPHQYPRFPGSQPLGIVAAPPQGWPIRPSLPCSFSWSEVCRSFNAHRAGVVQRFSPIHL
jgi:hypothetical protein